MTQPDTTADRQPERVHKILAAAGVASRRASEELIRSGRVTVDGQKATIGQKADPDSADIRVDGERINVPTAHTYLMLNKPQGIVTTANDPQGRPTVLDIVDARVRLFPVGRLDMDTEGLLLLTTDGDLAHHLTHPRFGVERSYLALINGPVRKDALDQLLEGVVLEDGIAQALSARVTEQHAGQTLVEVVLAEGRNREVRRMFAALGLNLIRLARTAYGGVELGDLPQGKSRPLTPREVGTLRASGSPAPGGGMSKRRRASRDERRARQSGR